MKKPIFQALMTGLIFVAAYYAFQVVQGMYLTYTHVVPGLAGQYASAVPLPKKISFGAGSSPAWRVVEFSGLMLLGIIVYYTGRTVRRKKSK
ncbi:hypothetical protein C2I18_24545 [Paenibacillus sp. PK3_47]|uniref:hypothetical protein n=1 Tax=Paenibacillus sp. PK3_47 TaxID=2072642 RepID=UPI00201E2C0B|nr:hypothetical protein [Paenibacillus sp. PK3_47]UQZ36421.1 hypothetical protein C2I18_24545 [Paenibacillus sp. PK3_47]